ncbi:MAG TPA: NAD(P)-dependent oxidoreductase [Pseudomonadales bacterium]
MSAPRAGFIGIGTMGWPMAANLVKGGVELTVYDSNAAQVAAFCNEHPSAHAAQTLADIAAQDFVVTMLPTGQIVHEVLVRADQGAFFANVRSGTVIIDMSSSEPTGTQALARLFAAKGVAFVDAPVSGARPRALAGTLTIMIGGDDREAIAKAKPLLAKMGERLFDTGGSGSGHAVKALNNFLGATAFAATSEAVLVAQRFGLDTRTLVDIVNVSTGRSFISDVVMKEHVLDGKFATGFALGLLAKDVKIAADLAEAVRLDAPLLKLVSERWASARDAIGYDADNTEAIKSWDTNLHG